MKYEELWLEYWLEFKSIDDLYENLLWMIVFYSALDNTLYQLRDLETIYSIEFCNDFFKRIHKKQKVNSSEIKKMIELLENNKIFKLVFNVYLQSDMVINSLFKEWDLEGITFEPNVEDFSIDDFFDDLIWLLKGNQINVCINDVNDDIVKIE